MDQRTCIKFCVKNEIKCARTFEMLTVAFGESTLSRTQVQLWYNRFKEGREDINDDARPGRPSTSTTDKNIEAVKKRILDNSGITIREVADDVGISFGSCQSIFTDVLGMKHEATNIVPKVLNFEQKQCRMDIAQEMLTTFNDDPALLKKVITGGESWVYGYDTETKVQSSQWTHSEEPRPKKARQVRSNVKVLLTVFFDCNGVVHHEFLPQGRTVNKEYNLKVMHRLSEAICQKRTELWNHQSWILHHDNPPAHTSMLVCEFFVKNKTVIMPQPPYSPDLATADFFLFLKLKTPKKRKRFATIEEIKEKSKQELLAIPKNAFRKCFEDYKNPLA